jgi:hypothetical protein
LADPDRMASSCDYTRKGRLAINRNERSDSMACKRSAVRARLAPQVRSKTRTNRTASTAAKYSNGGRLGRRIRVRIGQLARLGPLARHRIPGAEPALVSLSPGQIRVSSVSDFVIRSPPGPPAGPFLPAAVAAFASGLAAPAVPAGSIHSTETASAGQGCAFADGGCGRLGTWCPWCQSDAGRAGAPGEAPCATRRTRARPGAGRQVACRKL